MAVKIPFVVQPNLKPVMEQVGTETSGKIEIERRGYVTVSEKAFVQAATEGDDSQGRLYALVTKIASETGHTSQQVLDDVSGGQPPAYVDPYIEDFVNCMAGMERFQTQISIMAATALLTNRVNPKITVEQVMDLHPELIEELHKFYNEEESGSLQRLSDSSEQKEAEDGEEAGKPSGAS